MRQKQCTTYWKSQEQKFREIIDSINKEYEGFYDLKIDYIGLDQNLDKKRKFKTGKNVRFTYTANIQCNFFDDDLIKILRKKLNARRLRLNLWYAQFVDLGVDKPVMFLTINFFEIY